MSHYKKIAFLFPGQGAQYPGMAKDFVENFASARHLFEEADDLIGRKVSTLILNGPVEELTETRNSQVGIYVACVALLRVFREQFPHLTPAVCAGLSLGEYTALHASERLSFADCLQLVQWRGQYMNEACEKTQGTMAVVLGLEAQAVEALVQALKMPHDLWVANFNCPGQVVLSGTLKGITAGSEAAKAKGAKRVLPLQVHGAFHSGLMRLAEESLADKVLAAPIRDSSIDFVMNVPGNFVKDISQIKTYLIQQVTHPVKWEQSIRAMAAKDIDLFIEIGCGKTLSGFNKRIGVTCPTLSIETVKDLELLCY